MATLLPRRVELRELLALAVPVVIVQVGLMTMGVVDTIIVGHYATNDLAATALGNLVYFSLAMFGLGVLMSLDPLVAQAVGAKDTVAVARGIQRGLLLGLGLTVLTSLVYLPVRPILELFRQPPTVIPLASQYVYLSIPGLLPFFSFVVLRQSLQAMKRTRPILLAMLTGNLVNVALNWVFVFGNLGSPEMGAPGSALASTIARWSMAFALLAFAWDDLHPFLVPWRPEAFDRAALARMLRLGAPIGIQFTLESGVFAVIGLLMGGFGPVPVAGHQVALNVASLTFMVPLGVSAAGAVLVGQAVGRDDPEGARRAALSALLVGGGFMAVSAIFLSTMPGWIARVYTSEAPVAAMAMALLPIAGVFQIFDGLQVVAGGVLRGSGDTRTPMIVNLIGFWFVGLPISLLLGFQLGGGPTGLWWGLVGGLAAVAAFLVVRVRIRFRGPMERLTVDPVGS